MERDGFLALVEKRPDGAFGNLGSPGILIDGAFAVLVWKQGAPRFVARGRETPATAAQVEALRLFDADLRAALG